MTHREIELSNLLFVALELLLPGALSDDDVAWREGQTFGMLYDQARAVLMCLCPEPRKTYIIGDVDSMRVRCRTCERVVEHKV